MRRGKNNNPDKHPKYKKRMTPVSIALCGLFILFGCLSVFLFHFRPPEDFRFNNERAAVLDGNFRITVPGGSFEGALPAAVNVKGGESYTLSRILNADTDKGNSVLFYTQQSGVCVRLGEQEIYSTENKKGNFAAVGPGSFWHSFRLPPDYDGKLLHITISPMFSQYGRVTPIIYIGTKASFLYMIFVQGIPSLILNIPVFNSAVILLILSAFIAQSGLRRRVLRLGLFGAVVSIWSLLESRMTQLFWGDMVYASFLLFFCFYLIPVLASAFLLTFSFFRAKREFRVIFWISFAVFVAVQLLCLSGIFYYIELIGLVHLLLLTLLIFLIRCWFVSEKSDLHDHEEIYIYKAVLMLGIFSAVDIALFYLVPELTVGNATRIGMLVFILYIGISIIRQIGKDEIEKAKTKVYHDLAFRDVMTGLFNRTAFERYLSEYRRRSEIKKCAVLIFDMNHLKRINDTYGHSQGDIGLKTIAECLKTVFKEKCSCYRIGGDEFCVIAREADTRQVANQCLSLKHLVSERSQSFSFTLSVACGFCEIGTSGIDDAIKKADRAMYADKLYYTDLCP